MRSNKLLGRIVELFGPADGEVAFRHLGHGLETRELLSGDYLVRQGETIRHIAFLEEGLLRKVVTNDDGNEFTLHFVTRGGFAAPYLSLLHQKPASEGIQALSPSRVVLVPADNYRSFVQDDPVGARIGRRIAEELLAEKEAAERSLVFKTASQRLEEFQNREPELWEQVPRKVLASALGIDPASLSRLLTKQVRS